MSTYAAILVLQFYFIFNHVIFYYLFLKYTLLIMLLQLSHFFSPLPPSTLHPSFLQHHPLPRHP